MNIIITDLPHIKQINLESYEIVYLVGYAKDNLNELLAFESKKIKVILPSSNFDKAYNHINRHIANFVDSDLELLSLFKLCKEDLFNIGMIMIALKENLNDIKIKTTYNDYLFELNLISNKQSINSKQKKINYFKQALYLFAINIKVLGLFFKSLFIKSINIDILLVDYSSKRVLGCLEEDGKTLFLPFNTNAKMIDFNSLLLFYKYQIKLFKLSIKYKILHQTIAKQSYHLMNIISISSYYNPKVLLGAFDASANADIYYMILKEKKIKFGCYSHGYNYDFRTEYIYIPFDFYFVWSEMQLEQVKKGNYIENNCDFYVTGCSFYNNVDFSKLHSLKKEIKYDILIVGEYYYHNYSAQPFNSIPTLKLANVLKKYKDKYKICVRPRNQDEYYDDMYSVLKDDVVYSFPKNELTSTTTILEDIQSSKVVISMLSGGMHDALLSHTPVIQANFLGIKEPKEFDINNVVYYTDTPEKLETMLDDFFDEKLEILDYDVNNKKYFNDGIFDIKKVKKVINDNL